MPIDRDVALVRIRHKLASGELPCEQCLATWVGPGLGRPCAGCDARVGAEAYEVECDTPAGSTISMHRECFLLWQDECVALARQTTPDRDG
jgi:hypothetical protein